MSSRAEILYQKGVKKQKAFFGGAQKYEDAAEFFQKAGNCYKLERQWREAAGAFEKAVECNIKVQSRLDAVNNCHEAANCYKKCSIPDAIRCLSTALEFELDDGRLHSAARHMKDIAELHESQADYDEAIRHFERAADIFQGEEAHSSATGCRVRVASLCALHKEEYGRAAETYESLGMASLDNNLTHWSARDYFLRAGICRLCMNDFMGARESIERYSDMDVTFGTTRESQLLRGILEAADEGDVEKFTATVFDFDSVCKLDNWKTTLLLKVKNLIREGDSLT